MAILPIRQFGDPGLRQKSTPVDHVADVHRRLAADMLDTMREAPGVGLAGNQIGVLERVFVWEVGERHGVFFNPVITKRSAETEVDEEGCLSLPGINYPVERALSVVVEGLDAHGHDVVLEADDLLARVCQHEIDHLDGVLFIDRLADDLRREAIRELAQKTLGLPARVRAPQEL